MAVQYSTVRKYGTLQFLLKSMVRLYSTRLLWRYGYGTLVRNVRTNAPYYASTLRN